MTLPPTQAKISIPCHTHPLAARPQLAAVVEAGPAQGPAPRLSRRKKDVLRRRTAGPSTQEIAARRVIALTTAKIHAKNILARLGVDSRTAAVARARQLHLL
ncbi:MAG: hypothetical protein GYA17_16650 [Chloroflexi bacterium]|nr:LuxR C-terminal-related transcriptional regulator [Anaerolineaceae bacterium]NMB89988.1 hypothetical protein [Chloroflexota bacterium]